MFGLQDVAVNVVGKYRYYMDSAGEHGRLPIIVDIILARLPPAPKQMLLI